MAGKPLILTPGGGIAEGSIPASSVTGWELLTDPDIPHPTLALLFDSGLPLDPRITFTRASQATYVDALGRIQTADIDEPRLDYDPVTGVCKGLLMERAATNTAVQSGNLASASWSTVGGGTTKTVLPQDGLFTPARVASGGEVWHRVDVFAGSGITDGATVTVTAFYVPGTSGRVRVIYQDNVGAGSVQVSGTPGNVAPSTQNLGTISSISDVAFGAGGLRRLTYTFTITASLGTSPHLRVGVGPDTVTAGNDVVVYGVQVETGTVATSYIPTEGSPATRAADSAVVADLADWYNPEQGTLLVEAIPGPSVGAVQDFASLTDGTNDNRIQVFKSADSQVTFYAAGQGSGIPITNAGPFDPDAVARLAFTYPLPTMLYRDGQAYGPTAGIPEPTITQLNVGGRNAGVQTGGHIRKILYFPRRLTDEQLRRLTAP